MFRMLKCITLCKQNFDYVQDTRVIYNTSSAQDHHTLCYMMPLKVNVVYLREYGEVYDGGEEEIRGGYCGR